MLNTFWTFFTKNTKTMEQQESKGNSQIRFWKSEKLFLTFWISNPLPFHSMRMGGLPSTKYKKNIKQKNIVQQTNRQTDKQKKEKQQTYRQKQVFLFFLKETKIMNLFLLSSLTLRHNDC
jgi:hypothetical protein